MFKHEKQITPKTIIRPIIRKKLGPDVSVIIIAPIKFPKIYDDM